MTGWLILSLLIKEVKMKRIKNEFELNYWFRKNYKKLGFSKIIKESSKSFPDFIMLENGKEVKVELEIKSSNFLLHKHPIEKVDKIICIEKDVDLDVPVIELKDFRKINFDEDSPHSIKNKVLNLFKKEKVMTSSDVAKKLNLQWNTADKWLMELALEEKIERMKKSGVNLWMLR